MVENGLEKIVGKENVLTGSGKLKEYVADSNGYPLKFPSCAVRPASTDELQEIVRWANEQKIPLVPVSSGSPHLRGDTIPDAENAVIVDLRRMNKILRVDASNRVAIVEPGVTFEELQDELAKDGMCAYMPLAPRSTKSVLSSVLERDPILMPGLHFDSTDPMLCAEIVFGTGDKLRTGEASGPDTLEEQWEIGKAQISPFGPTQMDPQRLISGAQGTVGIVTWMSLKCRFLSELRRAFFITGSSLEPLIELTYYLTRIRFTGNIFILNNVNLACLAGNDSQEIMTLQDKLPEWVLFVTCEGYGPLPDEKVQYLEADLRELAEKYGLEIHDSIASVEAEDFADLLSKPSDEPYWKQRMKGSFRDVFFLTTLGNTPRFSNLVSGLAQQRRFPAENIGVYIQPVAQGTSCHCEFDLYYDNDNREELDMVKKIEIEAVDQLEEQGAFFSRPYGDWADIAYRRAGDTAEMQKKIKNIFDPNWILNPGKLCFKQDRNKEVIS
ncbi:MAG: FAD-binding oxidoreductase [Dehalococcoidales bacterium]|nr:FAD-binding oxidoreductase [Dehalococcoidales bacterium]